MVRQLLVNVGGLLGGTVALMTVLWALQRQLIYLPSGPVLTPVEVGLDAVEEISIRTEDGLSLSGWFLSAATPEPAGAVIVFPGNAGNRSLRAPLAAALSAAGLDVLLFDYRGYGGNPGTPSEQGLLTDAGAAHAWIQARSRAGPDRMIYFGESLGAGVATALALEEPPRALVLRSPFTSLADVGRLHYPFLPVRSLLRDRFPVVDHVARYGGPVLVVAGEADTIVPPAQSRRVAEAAAGPSRFVLVPAAGHNDRALLDGPVLLDALMNFLRQDAALPVL
ncbi:MAG: alpha/beta hydrolase [Egibacteraceae bacterium]